MDMKRHMLICFLKSMLVNKKKEWDSCKMEVVIKKRWEIVIMKINYKKSNYEIVKLENEVIIF
jgi:hypothetical protein